MSRSYREESDRAKLKWAGPVERYDLLKEFAIAMVVVLGVVIALSIVFSAPAAKAITFQFWAKNAPDDFATTTMAELTQQSESGQYGPPYNQGGPSGSNQIQYLGPISMQKLGGIHLPVNSAQDFVLGPMKAWSATSPSAKFALDRWDAGGAAEQAKWVAAIDASTTASVVGDRVVITGAKGDTGPIADILTVMYRSAAAGALDSQLVGGPDRFYQMDYTKPLLYLADGQILGEYATKYHLQGDQWGVMNEIGLWPGQPWLWFYSLFYQIPPWSTIGTDIIVIVTVVPLVLLVALVPFIPGLRNLPKWLGVYKIIWRSYYREFGSESARRGTPGSSARGGSSDEKK